MKILNLGCGTKTSDYDSVINIDWSVYLRLKRAKIAKVVVPFLMRGSRLTRFNSLPDNILVHNLAKGIPFGSDSIDAVYHSHMLEHLDRDVAENFLREAKRVLKPGGTHRIVVPDFEAAAKAYVTHLSACDSNKDEARKHDSYIGALIEQSVRKEAFGTSQQNSLRRFIENLVLGDARRRGETHQWMYDRISLKEKLLSAGYNEVYVQDFNTSRIPDWRRYALDVDNSGGQYKPGSLYVEAVK